MNFQDFTQMPVWKFVFELLLHIHKLIQSCPSDEPFGFVSNIRKLANSIVRHIAEGFRRCAPKEKTRFYQIARESVYELRRQLLASYALPFVEDRLKVELIQSCEQIIGELNAMMRTLTPSTIVIERCWK